jgi:acyl-CoA-binding protein
LGSKEETMDIEALFEEAVSQSKSLPSQPNQTLLELYALYKQATVGAASGERPGPFDFVGRAKYDAWAKLKGMSRETAMQTYVDRVKELAG